MIEYREEERTETAIYEVVSCDKCGELIGEYEQYHDGYSEAPNDKEIRIQYSGGTIRRGGYFHGGTIEYGGMICDKCWQEIMESIFKDVADKFEFLEHVKGGGDGDD